MTVLRFECSFIELSSWQLSSRLLGNNVVSVWCKAIWLTYFKAVYTHVFFTKLFIYVETRSKFDKACFSHIQQMSGNDGLTVSLWNIWCGITNLLDEHWLNKGIPLQWRHNGHDSVSNHQPHDCLLNRLSRRRSKKTSKLRVTGLCAGNSPGTGTNGQ